MNFPCPTQNPCANDNPFANNSSEAPDPFLFHSLVFGQVTPPLGTDWGQATCVGTATSAASQTAADLAATVTADECVVNTWQTPGGPTTDPNPPVPPPVNTRGSGMPFKSYLNTPQSATVNCPDGTPFVYTVPAGLFFGLSQAAADAAALSYAQQQAPMHMVCLSNLVGQICAGVPFNGVITATGPSVGAFNDWELVGSLPPGLNFLTGPFNFSFNTITGTPTVPGMYSFMVTVTTPTKDMATKDYTLLVAGITNAGSIPNGTVGTAYSFQLLSAGVVNPIFSVESGALPAGLAMDIYGNITGTPTTGGTSNFTLGVTEAGTGLTCNVNAAIRVTSTDPCMGIPQNIIDCVWVPSNPPNACNSGTLVNGQSGDWTMTVNNSTCPIGTTANVLYVWTTQICNLGAPYLLTLTVPWDDSGTIGGNNPSLSGFEISLTINGVNSLIGSGDLFSNDPNPLVASLTLPGNQISTVQVNLHIFMAGPPNAFPNPTVNVKFSPSGGNLTVTPFNHP